jgi:hemolysin activation/secretion protein
LSLQYIFRGGDYIEIFWEKFQSNLISTYDLDIVTELPEFADVKTNSFGLGGKVSELDYRINPRSGFDLDLKAGFGNREIRKNPAINQEVYDSLILKSNSYKANGKIRVFVPFLKRHTVLFGGQGGLLVNDKLFTNELYRIGGLKTLRGFDEESIFASSYFIATLEYRFLLEQNSFLSVFYNQAWYENQVGNTLITDTPFGFGAGISFQTGIGIFSLSYALGKQFDNPILFRASKLHFGFVNYF